MCLTGDTLLVFEKLNPSSDTDINLNRCPEYHTHKHSGLTLEVSKKLRPFLDTVISIYQCPDRAPISHTPLQARAGPQCVLSYRLIKSVTVTNGHKLLC